VKLVDEFRDGERARRLVAEIARVRTRPWVIMEVCGGQTHSILRYGIDRLLPEGIELVHGPGCPVCVTPVELIDQACAIAARPDTLLASFGDMLRVPGSAGSLLDVKARGGDVRVVYSPLDAVALAARHPGKQVVFFAVGFETTAPPNAASVLEAEAQGLTNFSVLVSHVLVPPALGAILQAPDNRVQGFLGPGHVCAVMGTGEYAALATASRSRSRWPASSRSTSWPGCSPACGPSRKAAPGSRTSIPGRWRPTATPGPGPRWTRSSRSRTASGGASAPSRPAA
jgi:hydrogenase expression/formation protein HypD